MSKHDQDNEQELVEYGEPKNEYKPKKIDWERKR
jgi:hypothetical protein